MVWDQDVRVIVMLTAESEGGHVKCHPYWAGREYGPIKLRLLSERKVSLDMDKYRSHPAAAAAAATTTAATADMSESSTAPGDDASGRRRASTLACVGGNATANGPSRLGFPLGVPGSQNETPFVIVRKFSLSHTNEPFQPIREVTQLHYSSWPDFGAPAKPGHLLAVIELANAMQSSSSPVDKTAAMSPPSLAARFNGAGDKWRLNQNHFLQPMTDEPESDEDVKPMLVHCSAGCGRTGTFCTVDAVIDMLKRQRQSASSGGHTGTRVAASDEREVMGDGGDISWLENESVDLVAKTVEDFRTQRLSMVQSLRQFVLCYETVAEWISKTQEKQGGRGNRAGRPRSESVRMHG